MAAGRRDFERAFGALLTLDVGEVEHRAVDLENFWLRSRQDLRAFEMVGELNERRGGNDVDVRARPCRFRSAGGRTDQTFTASVGANRSRQHACDRRDRAVKTEFAEHRKS
jgi:hypothetical protein